MGGKSGGRAPDPPDPRETAAAQAAANREAAIAQAQLNMIDQWTPYGSLRYERIGGTGPQFDQTGYDAAMAAWQAPGAQPSGSGQGYLQWLRNNEFGTSEQWRRETGRDGGGAASRGPAPNREDFYRGTESDVPRYRAITELSPEEQAIFDLEQAGRLRFGQIADRQLGQIGGTLSDPFTMDRFGAAPTLNEETRQSVLADILARQQPQFDRTYDQIQTWLAGRGITDPNSPAYKDAVDEFYRAQNDFGLAAGQAALGQATQLYGVEQDARSRAIQEALMERQVPLNELAAMMSGSQVSMPQFQPVPQSQIAPADVMGATYADYNARMNQFNQQQANQRSAMQGLFGLAGTGASIAAPYLMGPAAAAGGSAAPFASNFVWSDRRLKCGIRRIGTLRNGIPLYAYRYIWGGPRQIGVMADEARRVRPKAVKRLGLFDAVDYREVLA